MGGGPASNPKEKHRQAYGEELMIRRCSGAGANERA